jgi:hypothetical protein
MTWIPVEESLPDDEITVLIALSDGDVWFGNIEAGTWWYQGGISTRSVDVTHWMHLPEHPKC